MKPLYVANEGRFVNAVPAADVENALTALRATLEAEGAVVAAHLLAKRRGQVSLWSRIGTLRNLPMLSGEQLPRIC